MKHNDLYNDFKGRLYQGGGVGIHPQGSPYIAINPLAKLLIKLEITFQCPYFHQFDESFVDDIANRDALILALDAPKIEDC